MSWLLLLSGPASGAANMALDAALLEAAEAEGLRSLRLYGWDPPALSFGRNEPAVRRYDRAAIEARGLATVRRPTGGRAVWHDAEVTYAVAAPADTFGTLRETYHEIHTTIAAALRSLGAAVSLAGDRPADGVGFGACFASAAGGEVIAADGAKVVGSAQVRSGRAFLQHGSVLLSPGQQLVASVTRGGAGAPRERGVAELLAGAPAGRDGVCSALASAAAERWGAPREPGALPLAIRKRADELQERFESDAWTWRR